LAIPVQLIGYCFAEWKVAKVHPDYHVEGVCLSEPFQQQPSYAWICSNLPSILALRKRDGADRFMAEIRKMLSARACIRPSFSTADEILARRWFNTSVPLDRIGQAILLGRARKYVAWRNNKNDPAGLSRVRTIRERR
jgi:hypothetical protein